MSLIKRYDARALIARVDAELEAQDRYSIDELHMSVSPEARRVVEQYVVDVRELELRASEGGDIGVGARVVGGVVSSAVGAAIGVAVVSFTEGSSGAAIGGVMGGLIGFGTEVLFYPVAGSLQTLRRDEEYCARRTACRQIATARLEGLLG